MLNRFKIIAFVFLLLSISIFAHGYSPLADIDCGFRLSYGFDGERHQLGTGIYFEKLTLNMDYGQLKPDARYLDISVGDFAEYKIYKNCGLRIDRNYGIGVTKFDTRYYSPCISGHHAVALYWRWLEIGVKDVFVVYLHGAPISTRYANVLTAYIAIDI